MKQLLQRKWYTVFATLAAALVGFFVRQGQLRGEILEGGALAEGSFRHIVLLVLSIAYVGALIALLQPMEKRPGWKANFTPALAPNALQLVAALGLLAGNLLLVMKGGAAAPVMVPGVPVAKLLYDLLAPLGLLCAVCIGLFSVFCLRNRKPSPLLYMIASLYLVVRLIVCFQEWNTDPSIHDYCYGLLAAICCMLGTFQLAGFSFDKGKRQMCLFWSLCAVVFCAVTTADTLAKGDSSAILINLSLLLSMAMSSYQLLFTENPLPEENPAQEQPPESYEESDSPPENQT